MCEIVKQSLLVQTGKQFVLCASSSDFFNNDLFAVKTESCLDARHWNAWKRSWVLPRERVVPFNFCVLIKQTKQNNNINWRERQCCEHAPSEIAWITPEKVTKFEILKHYDTDNYQLAVCRKDWCLRTQLFVVSEMNTCTMLRSTDIYFFVTLADGAAFMLMNFHVWQHCSNARGTVFSSDAIVLFFALACYVIVYVSKTNFYNDLIP